MTLIAAVLPRRVLWSDHDPELRRRLVGCALALITVVALGGGPALLPREAGPAGSRGDANRSSRVFSSATLPRPRDAARAAAEPRASRSISPAPSKRTALVIGINRAAGSRPLHGAVRDAEMLREALTRYGFPARNVRVLTEREATATRIVEELDALADRTPADGRAVFAFAGHTRRRGGGNHFVAADGNLLSADAIARRLARVRAPMWVVLPTCYAGGYALPGIVGRDRVATFASRRNELAYELGEAGSYLVIHMVRHAMLDARAPGSVEQSFSFAERSIASRNPKRVPYIDDRFPGDFVLGPVTWSAPRPVPEDTQDPGQVADPEPPSTQSEPPKADPKRRSTPTAHMCGSIRFNCQR